MLKSTYSEGVKTDETTIISNGVRIEGKVSSDGNIRVDGEIQGDISSKSNVIVGDNGHVNGQINAESITIGGKVSGSVKAKDKITLEVKANLKGDLFTKVLVIEAGAKFDGNSKMGDTKDITETKSTLQSNLDKVK